MCKHMPQKMGSQGAREGVPNHVREYDIETLEEVLTEEMCRFTSELFLFKLEGGSFQLRWAVWTYWDLGSQNQ